MGLFLVMKTVMVSELHDPKILADSWCHSGAEKILEEVEVAKSLGRLCQPAALP